MLTKEVIKANAQLATLTDEQLTLLEQLSKNDEQTVIDQKVGEIHRQYDETILKSTGVTRDGAEKSYVYLERAAGVLKDKATSADTLQTQITTLTNEKAALEKSIKENATDAVLKKQLDDVNAELAQTKTQFNELNAKYAESQNESTKKMHDLQVDFRLEQGVSKVNFKPHFGESAQKMFLQNALNAIKQNTSEFIDDGKGGTTLVFKNKDGAILNNPNNGLKPYTAEELLLKELAQYDALAEGKKPAGSGSSNKQDSDKGATIDISAAKNQREATDSISQSLMNAGLTRGSSDFQDAFGKAWADNAAGELPMN